MLFGYEWELEKSPYGAWQWRAKDVREEHLIPDAHDPAKRHRPMMTTADLSLRFDPIYEPIARRFHQDQQAFADTFARAWFKLTHRDMGPEGALPRPRSSRRRPDLAGPDPCRRPSPDRRRRHHRTQGQGARPRGSRCRSWWPPPGPRPPPSAAPTSAAAPTAPACAWPPRTDWEVNQPEQLARVLAVLEGIQQNFNAAQADGTRVSLADLIVLAGCAAVEAAARAAGHTVEVPFTPGRTDASQEQTDAASFAVLEPQADGFRNYQKRAFSGAGRGAADRPGPAAQPERAGD